MTGRRAAEEEQVATFCVEEWGLPPITGRILGLLMICDPPQRSAGEIAETIQASRASLTSNMRFLTVIGLIRKVRVPGDRTAYYRIEDDAWHKVIQRNSTASPRSATSLNEASPSPAAKGPASNASAPPNGP